MKAKKILRVVLNIFFWAFVAGIASLAALVLIYGNDLPDYKKLATYAPPVATRLYASDGSLLIEYAEERRVFIDYADMPEDSVFTVSLYNDANEAIYTLFDISLAEIKEKDYLCTIEDQKVTYLQEGKTLELDLSLFDGTSGKYLIKAKHSTETDDKWDVWGGVYLRYSQTLARDYYIFGK